MRRLKQEPVLMAPLASIVAFRSAKGTAFAERKPTMRGRRGTTLSEVLVSTLVMSIGVVALATLFPISVLRSIQASQLTNAAVLRYNAEAHLKTIPEIVNVGVEWQPATNYVVGDTVVPTATTRARYPISAVFACTTGGMSGGLEPSWVTREGQTTNDNAAVWTTVLLRNYVVDPLGYLLTDPTDANNQFRGAGATGTREHFGNENGNPFLLLGNRTTNRFPAYGMYSPNYTAAVNEANAAALAILPDSWTQHAESNEVTYTAGNTNILLGNVNAAELASVIPQIAAPTPDLVPDRIVIYDASLRRSHTYTVDQTNPISVGAGNQAVVNWIGPALPTGFVPVKARVESLERRYSYVLSVRQRRSYSYVDVVVFFRRRYSIADEQVYSCVFRRIDRGVDGVPGSAGDDNSNGKGDATDTSELGWAGSDDKPRNFCVVQWHSSHTDPPFYKKGGFICDIHNLRWYRIIDVTEDILPPFTIANVTPAGYEVDPVGTDPISGQPNNRFVRLTLSEPVVEDSPMDTTSSPPNPFTPLQFKNGTVSSPGTVGGAMLMRGIVDVFPITPRSTWEQ